VLAEVIRSGLVESTHDGAAAAVHPDGSVLAAWGDIDRIFFLRSAAKPFQATVSQELGADLTPEEMAVACGSHRGQPVHVAIVAAMLDGAGLVESHLQCPPAWPAAPGERDRVVAGGFDRPRRLWHNCSGKHAAMLRACAAQGWPIDTYLDPAHPLQRSIFDLVAEAGGIDPGPVGVDGCGAPVFRGTVRSLARAFAQLGSVDRFAYAWSAMHRFPALTCDQGQPAALIATALDAVAKAGAEGSLGVSIQGDVGVAVRAWDGSSRATGPAALSILKRVSRLGGFVVDQLEDVIHAPVLGGEARVGEIAGRENSA
jgi:L-asparaginase II